MEKKQVQQNTSSSSSSQTAELVSGSENKALFAKFYAEHKQKKNAKMIKTSNAYAMLGESTEEWKIKGMKRVMQLKEKQVQNLRK